jgi:hypothetical protein
MLVTKAEERAKSVAAGHSYGEVETAIARVLNADAEAQVGRLRGRIQHLRRLGLTPPADSGPVVYTFEWAARWLLALRLERVGLNPVAVVKFIEDNWERKPGRKFPKTSLREVIEDARAPIDKKRPGYNEVWITVRFDDFMRDAFPQVGRVRPYWKPTKNPKFDNAKGFFDASKADAADMVVIPLTEVLRLLETELRRR